MNTVKKSGDNFDKAPASLTHLKEVRTSCRGGEKEEKKMSIEKGEREPIFKKKAPMLNGLLLLKGAATNE